MNRKTAIVTGGLGVLGSEVARCFVEAGVQVALPIRPGRTLADVPDQLRGAGELLFVGNADLNVESDVRAFVTTANERLGGVDILVHAAGGYAGGEAIGTATAATFDRMISLNLKTAFLMCTAVLPIMRSRKFGRIITIASKPALSPTPLRGPYAVAKRGLITLTETIAEEVKGTGITANALAPSIIVTPANRQSMPDADISNWVTPSEIAGIIMFLCSDAARSVNGNVIRVFGGV